MIFHHFDIRSYRVKVYASFERAFVELLDFSEFENYRIICSLITKCFAYISSTINKIEVCHEYIATVDISNIFAIYNVHMNCVHLGFFEEFNNCYYYYIRREGDRS